ncbi:hypothetical protein CEXT_456891 [Caerostris extrusa]|uniref:Ankyrin repeat protein n=1 Tax=Caerostris extrusa TaxID=172846 RepID=A0AAV4MIL0_CAEEX|nr:hypothetical protein CEXT_456891 [Caerostris extrusa]
MKTITREPLSTSVLKGGHKNIVKILIEKGADIDKKDDAGSTPLHLAAGRDHGDVVQLLISKGADVHAEDSSKSTTLHFCCFDVP